MRTRLVIAFGGGKGGVGKSLVCSAVATAMARRGARVVLLDADLGAANMHTLLGVTNPATTLDDFWSGRIPDIEGVCLSTPIDGLRLLSGAASILRAANPRRRERERLARAFLELDADVLVIDLGAGTQDNTLDFFNMASEGLVVTGTEPTAIQNAYAFIKAAVYRLLDRTFRDAPGARALVARAAAARGVDRIESVDKLLDALHTAEPSWAERAATVLARGHLGLVVNQAGPREAQRVLGAIGVVCQRYLSLELPLVSALPSDPAVVRAVHRMTPVILEEPHGAFARAATALADHLLASGRRVDVDALLAALETPEVAETSVSATSKPPTSLLEALSHAGVLPTPDPVADTPGAVDKASAEEQDWSAVAAETDAAVQAIDEVAAAPEAAVEAIDEVAAAPEAAVEAIDEVAAAPEAAVEAIDAVAAAPEVAMPAIDEVAAAREASTPDDLGDGAIPEVEPVAPESPAAASAPETTVAVEPDLLAGFPAFPDDDASPPAPGAMSPEAAPEPALWTPFDEPPTPPADESAAPESQAVSASAATPPADAHAPLSPDAIVGWSVLDEAVDSPEAVHSADPNGSYDGPMFDAPRPAAHVEPEDEPVQSLWPALDDEADEPGGSAWSALDEALASAEAASGARRPVEAAANGESPPVPGSAEADADADDADLAGEAGADEVGSAFYGGLRDAGPAVADRQAFSVPAGGFDDDEEDPLFEPPRPTALEDAEDDPVQVRFDDPAPALGFDAAFEAWAEEAAPELSREFMPPVEGERRSPADPAADSLEAASAQGDAALEAWVSSLVSGVQSEPVSEAGPVSVSSLRPRDDDPADLEDLDDSGEQAPEFDLSWGGGLPPEANEAAASDAPDPRSDERRVVERATSEWPDVLIAPDESVLEERSQNERPLFVDETLELPDLGGLRAQLALLMQPEALPAVDVQVEAEVAVEADAADPDLEPGDEDESEWSGWGELAAEVEAAERGEAAPVSRATPPTPEARPSPSSVTPTASAATRTADVPAPPASPPRIPERPTMRLPLMSPYSIALPGLSSTIAAALVREAMGSGGGHRPQAEAWDDTENFDPWETGAPSGGAPQGVLEAQAEGALILEDVVETAGGWLYVRSADLGAAKAVVRQTVLRSGRVLHSEDVGYGATSAGVASASGLEVLGRSHAELVQRLRVGRLVFNETVPGARR